MARLYQPISSCFEKPEPVDVEPVTMDYHSESVNTGEAETCPNSTVKAPTQSSWMGKVTSGLYNIGAGAVGIGVGGIKWAANTTISVGSGAISLGQSAVTKVASANRKPKKD